jgi:pimeloyl-ACP methyl ester carboxylesterase
MIHYVEGTHRSFACQQQAFAAAGYCTLAIDMRGRGQSVKTDPATFFYTNQALANDIHSVLVALNIEGPIIMVGAVSGGYPVIKYFELFSTPSSPLYDANRTLSHMIVINSGPGLTTVPDCAGLPGCVQDSTTCCVAGATCPFPCAGPNCCVCYDFGNVTCAGINFFFTPLFSTPAGYLSAACSFAISAMAEVNCSPQIDAARKAFTQDFLATTGDIQINLYKNSLAEDLRPVIPTINIPFLVVYGDLSPTIPGSSLYLAQNAPNATLALFQGASELPHVTMVSKFNTLMSEFITGASLATSITFPFTGCDVCPLFVPTRPINCP